MRVALCFLLLFAAGLSAPGADSIKVASFSPILTELAQKIGGEHIQVSNLIPPDTDPHEYQPTPADLRVLADVRLILSPSTQLGGFLGKLQQSADPAATVLSIGDLIDAIPTESGAADPHWWHSVDHTRKAAELIAKNLVEIDPAHQADYGAHLQSTLAELEILARWVQRKVAELPRDKRKLVTSHDAFAYFARDYDFAIYAIEGVSTESEPSNRHVSELIDRIKREGVKAIFLESTLNPKVTREITRETGAKLGGTLYADGLGSGDASTYEGMMKHNVTTIVGALK